MQLFLVRTLWAPCFIIDTENLGRESAGLLRNQYLSDQETKTKLSVEVSLKHFWITGERSPQNCFRDTWNSSAELSFVEGGIRSAESAVVH